MEANPFTYHYIIYMLTYLYLSLILDILNTTPILYKEGNIGMLGNMSNEFRLK